MIGSTSHRCRTLSPITSWMMALVAVACSQQQKKQPRPPVPVTVTAAQRTAVPYMVTANGLVTPIQTASVTPQVDGLMTRVAFREGDDVTRGQILFQIDPRPYRAAYEQALATLARDRATAANAEREVNRYDQLVQQDYVTKEQADQQRATAAAAMATVQGDEAAVATAKFNLDNTTIRAPISGRTGSLLVRVGNVVHASGGTPLVVINQIMPIFVRFAVPATQLPLIQRYGAGGGLSVTAVPGVDPTQNSSDTSADVGGGPSSTPASDSPAAQQLPAGVGVHGTLSFIDNAVDTATGTVVLKATFPNRDGRLWAGEFLATSLQLYVEQNALVVPTQAVTTGQRGAYVYVVGATGTAQQRPVLVERVAGNSAIIASGLNDGEQVVTDGQSRLTPGAKVAVRAAPGTNLGTGVPGVRAASVTAGPHRGHGRRTQ